MAVRTQYLPTPCDLTLESLEEALRLLGEDYWKSCIVCGRDFEDTAEAISVRRDHKMPMIVFVPEALLNNKLAWALVGADGEVISAVPH